MLHEFLIKINEDGAAILSEKLTSVGLYNLTYDQPIEVEKIQNGYGVKHLENAQVDFKIYVEESEATKSPDEYMQLIAEVIERDKQEISYQKIEDSSWDYSLEDIDLGNGWVICYSEDTAQYEGKKIFRFDPQAAFGTGLHETTQDCLRLILNDDYTGKSVLDLGAGSGILTVAAALKKARQVDAIDFEPVESEVSHNVALNNITTEITVHQEDLMGGEFKITQNYDRVFINIGGDEALQIIQRHELLKKSNNFLISGMVEWHIAEVIRIFENAGFTIDAKRQTNEWVTISFKKEI